MPNELTSKRTSNREPGEPNRFFTPRFRSMQYPARNTAAGTRTQPTPEGSRPWNPPSIEAQLVLPWLPRRHRSRLQCKEMFAVQEDKRSDAERSGTHAFEPSARLMKRWDLGRTWTLAKVGAGLTTEAKPPCRLSCSTPGLDSGARMARSASCETDTGCRHQHAVQAAVALC